MEHITKEELANGLFRLTPDEGYLILDIKSGRTHSVVITKTPREFTAIEIN